MNVISKTKDGAHTPPDDYSVYDKHGAYWIWPGTY